MNEANSNKQNVARTYFPSWKVTTNKNSDVAKQLWSCKNILGNIAVKILGQETYWCKNDIKEATQTRTSH